MSKTVLFQIIQFSISTLFSSIFPINRRLSGATTLGQGQGQSGPGSDGNRRVSEFPKAPVLLEPQDTRWETFTPCRDAVNVFYSPIDR